MLWLIVSLVFLLLRVAPGDPVDAVLGVVHQRQQKLRCGPRLDQSLLHQYVHYLHGLLQGDLGQALINQEAVSNIINRTLPASLECVIALVAAAFIGPASPALQDRRKT